MRPCLAIRPALLQRHTHAATRAPTTPRHAFTPAYVTPPRTLRLVRAGTRPRQHPATRSGVGASRLDVASGRSRAQQRLLPLYAMQGTRRSRRLRHRAPPAHRRLTHPYARPRSRRRLPAPISRGHSATAPHARLRRVPHRVLASQNSVWDAVARSLPPQQNPTATSLPSCALPLPLVEEALVHKPFHPHIRHLSEGSSTYVKIVRQIRAYVFSKQVVDGLVDHDKTALSTAERSCTFSRKRLEMAN